MAYLSNITKYFRQSLIDSTRLSPEDKDILPAFEPVGKQISDYITLENEIWQQGKISSQIATKILGSESQKEVLLFPRADLVRYHGGQASSQQRKVLLPLAVLVLLKSDGVLQPSNTAPWVPREWLAPNTGSDAIDEVDHVDGFFAKNPYEAVDDWQNLVGYCHDLLAHILQNKQVQSIENINEFSLLGDYEPTGKCLFQCKIPPRGANKHIIVALDVLLKRKENQYPELYQRYCCRTSLELKPFQPHIQNHSLARQHLGQMTGEFPLAPNQRNALHHFLKQSKYEILAVNGPPGTGKTTFLRSVVANLWTEAAIAESEPPLIVATSNNNQAVTNILDSFAKVDERGLAENMKGRWLPEVDSYGLYFCSAAKATKDNPFRHVAGDKGCMQGWQTHDFLEKARVAFLEKANAWQVAESIKKAKELLHKSMQSTKKDIEQGVTFLERFQKIEQSIKGKYGSVGALQQKTKDTQRSIDKVQSLIQETKNKRDAFVELWGRRGIVVRLLMWLPLINKQEYRRNKQLLQQYHAESVGESDAAVEAWVEKSLQNLRASLNRHNQTLQALQKLNQEYHVASALLSEWLEKHRRNRRIPSDFFDAVTQVNDCILRFKLFKLATHYWEARWLLEMQGFDISDDKKSPAKVERKLRRYAKLMPCFVSTFYMLPSFLLAGKYSDNVWQDVPLFDTIDLLIVDEAGQALPEVSAVAFAFAKKALIVGDTDQIEPVWSVPVSVDRSNMQTYKLLESEKDYDDFWLQSGLMASSGNLMTVAQRQCAFHQFPKLQRGLYLTEHRRCYDSIIAYCNDLIYQGVLEPLRGEAKIQMPWSSSMCMIEVRGDSQRYGGSRANTTEAQEIAQWVVDEKHAILEYAKQCDARLHDLADYDVLQHTLGIITPFAMQAVMIRDALKKHSISGITVGTVHSLQGAERLIVLFSSVYSVNDASEKKFYDRGGNMLNVAVSRAKDVFIVFGHPEVFGRIDKTSPSGKLRARLMLQG